MSGRPARPVLAASVAVFRGGRVLLATRTKPPAEGVHHIRKWFPTRACVRDMLDECKFTTIEDIPDPTPGRGSSAASIHSGRRNRGASAVSADGWPTAPTAISALLSR